MSDEWSPKKYRTWAEAQDHLPTARAILREVRRRLPDEWIDIDGKTLFVGTEIPELVACVAVTVPGSKRSLAPLEFELDLDREETIERIVGSLIRWHGTVVSHDQDPSDG